MSDIVPYSEGSSEFAEMIRQAETDPKAAFAAANCYMHGSSRFCQDWYTCFVLKETTEQEYDVNLALVQKCLEVFKGRDEAVSSENNGYCDNKACCK
jgi:hypothetical protein